MVPSTDSLLLFYFSSNSVTNLSFYFDVDRLSKMFRNGAAFNLVACVSSVCWKFQRVCLIIAFCCWIWVGWKHYFHPGHWIQAFHSANICVQSKMFTKISSNLFSCRFSAAHVPQTVIVIHFASNCDPMLQHPLKLFIQQMLSTMQFRFTPRHRYRIIKTNKPPCCHLYTDGPRNKPLRVGFCFGLFW